VQEVLGSRETLERMSQIQSLFQSLEELALLKFIVSTGLDFRADVEALIAAT
jgi:hypothetical protein